MQNVESSRAKPHLRSVFDAIGPGCCKPTNARVKHLRPKARSQLRCNPKPAKPEARQIVALTETQSPVEAPRLKTARVFGRPAAAHR